MKRFAVYSYGTYYPQGFLEDIDETFNSFEEAMEFAKTINDDVVGVFDFDTRIDYPKKGFKAAVVKARYTAEHYDYEKQTWIGADGRYLCCAHPREMNCKCYGRLHYGELATKEK